MIEKTAEKLKKYWITNSNEKCMKKHKNKNYRKN